MRRILSTDPRVSEHRFVMRVQGQIKRLGKCTIPQKQWMTAIADDSNPVDTLSRIAHGAHCTWGLDLATGDATFKPYPQPAKGRKGEGEKGSAPSASFPHLCSSVFICG